MRAFFMHTQRLGFGEWTMEDETLAQALWGNAEVSAYITAGGRFSQQEIIARLSLECEQGRRDGVQYWPLFLRADDTFIGCCGLRPFPKEAGAYEFGVHLLPAFWGKGFAAEAGHAALQYGAALPACAAIYAGHHPENEASRRLLPKLGFVYMQDMYYAPTGLMHPGYRYAP